MCVSVPAGAWAVSVRSARGNSGTLLGSIWSGQGAGAEGGHVPCHMPYARVLPENFLTASLRRFFIYTLTSEVPPNLNLCTS